MKETLYKRNANSSIQEWTIETSGDKYWTVYGQVGGQLITSEPTVCVGKNIGKKNETAPKDQAVLEAVSAINKKTSKEHYFKNINDIDCQVFIKPMLAHKLRDHKKKIKFPVYLDFKLDGMRCIASRFGPKSRRGESIVSVPHIYDKLGNLFNKFPDLVLDGELYNHKLRHELNEIMKLTRVTKPERLTPEFLKKSKEKIQYWVYDGWGFNGIKKHTPFVERRAALQRLLDGLDPMVRVLGYKVAHSFEEMDEIYEKAVEAEFEGHIIRYGNCPYEHKRSYSVLKRKDFEDDEFVVVGFEEGVGKARGLAFTANCITKDGVVFGVGLNFPAKYLKYIWNNQSEFIGQLLNVRYLKYSAYGAPLIGKGSAFRDDV